MDHIKRFVECLVPVTACDLKCSYCYVVQEQRRSERLPDFAYSPAHIAKALSQERLGGVCYISMCGAGETLIPREMPEIIRCLLEQGHYVNVTTNGTQTKRFGEIAAFPGSLLTRLHFAFSFHYLELSRTDKLDAFFNNVAAVRAAGCSFVVQLNLCDEYVPHLNVIKTMCEDRVGAAPQVAATRDERAKKTALMTRCSREEYRELGSRFESPLFDFTLQNFMVRRREYCHAGDWSFVLNLGNGVMKRCYRARGRQDIFADLRVPIQFEAVGHGCRLPYCVNSSHFMALGVIPSIPTPSYADLRDRAQAAWYTPHMRSFLSGKLRESNVENGKARSLPARMARSLGQCIRRGLAGARTAMRRPT
jgi:molybdenum cofactor biosynthesis enzyme MoaA